MIEIEEFVYNPTAPSKIVFQINSNSLKKALSKQVTKVYINTGIFTEFVKGQPETIIKKAKHFKQQDFIRGFAKSNDTTGKTKIVDLGFCPDSISEEDSPVKMTHKPVPIEKLE